MAPSLVFFLLAYATIGTWLTTAVFGKRLMQLQFSQLQKEETCVLTWSGPERTQVLCLLATEMNIYPVKGPAKRV